MFINNYVPINLLIVPSGFLQMFNVVIESSRSVTFSWIAPLIEEQNGVIVTYTLNITDAGTGVTFQRVVPSSQTSITLSSLTPFTTYFCSIAASTIVNIGPFSTLLTVSTLEDSECVIVVVLNVLLVLTDQYRYVHSYVY